MGIRDTPKVLRLARLPLELAEYKQRSPAEDDVPLHLRGSHLIYDDATGKLAIVYLELDDDLADVEAALQQVHFDPTHRSGGMTTTSRVFGNQPRNLPRRDFCTSAALAREAPAAHATIAKYAETVSSYYAAYNPELHGAHAATVGKVLDEWRLAGSVFTSGIINKNNPLMYHYDGGNFTNVWSNMLVFKRGTRGGHLACPDYGIKFDLPNNSLLMFDGQELLHGVTPIALDDDASYRYSIVFYSLKQMWHCLPITDEIARVRKIRTDREYKRLEKQLAARAAGGAP